MPVIFGRLLAKILEDLSPRGYIKEPSIAMREGFVLQIKEFDHLDGNIHILILKQRNIKDEFMGGATMWKGEGSEIDMSQNRVMVR